MVAPPEEFECLRTPCSGTLSLQSVRHEGAWRAGPGGLGGVVQAASPSSPWGGEFAWS